MLRIILILVILFSSCKKTEVQCQSPDIAHPDEFVDCPYGSGSFGKWIVDDYGLPAYEYTLRQENDARALWWNSAQTQMRTHWHQIGNNRFIATADNNGVVQLFSEENGYKWLNFYNEDEKNYSGNFAFIDDGENIWSTAYRFRPEGARTRRVFGIGYFMTETEYRGLNVKRITYAPYGDDPLLISEIIIENRSNETKEIEYYEYWDVNIHHMLMMLLSSGVLDPGIPWRNEEQRNGFNRYFVQSARIDETKNVGIIDTFLKYPEADELKIPSPGSSKEFDDTPPSIFLAPLDSGAGEGFIFDQNTFFGERDGEMPSNLRTIRTFRKNDEIPQDLHNVPALYQPLMITHKRRIIIEPGNITRLRYGYGYINSSNTLDFINNYTNLNDNLIKITLDNWRGKLAYFVPEKDAFLHREIAWHSYYLQSASYWREYLKTHVVSQGGEYLFGHGFDGATRDYCIFSVALTYLNPELAKEILRFVMLTTTPNGEMAYGNYGDTVVTGVVILSQPSDLDIFFLWAMAEYLLATRDYDFLNQRIPFYSPQDIFAQPSVTVLEHIRTAFEHLRNVVGTGEHGLIRMRTGDWSDGITWFTENPSLTEEKGESTFNTAFATYVLPVIAGAIEEYDGALAREMRVQAEMYRTAMEKQWGGAWYYRGWQGNGKPFGDDRIFLEPQVWSLIAGIPDREKADILINSIWSILDANSPVGARILYPPKDDIFGGLAPGTDVNGGIWHATNSLLAWAYSLYNPDYAWESFRKNTMASHGETYPDIWYGIWSGPDSYNSPESERPGEAAAHYATALTDHPVMNMNQHANPLLALIRIAGIKPERDGFTINPGFPFKKWALNFPLLGVRYDHDTVSGYIYSLSDGTIKLTVKLPETLINKELNVNVMGNEISYMKSNTMVTFDFTAPRKTRVDWVIEGIEK